MLVDVEVQAGGLVPILESSTPPMDATVGELKISSQAEMKYKQAALVIDPYSSRGFIFPRRVFSSEDCNKVMVPYS